MPFFLLTYTHRCTNIFHLSYRLQAAQMYSKQTKTLTLMPKDIIWSLWWHTRHTPHCFQNESKKKRRSYPDWKCVWTWKESDKRSPQSSAACPFIPNAIVLLLHHLSEGQSNLIVFVLFCFLSKSGQSFPSGIFPLLHSQEGLEGHWAGKTQEEGSSQDMILGQQGLICLCDFLCVRVCMYVFMSVYVCWMGRPMLQTYITENI